MRTRDRSSKKGSDVIFVWCQSVALQFSAPLRATVSLPRAKLSYTNNFFFFFVVFFAERMKRERNEQRHRAANGIRPGLMAIHSKKLSSLQTYHSALHCVCEVFP